MMTIIFLLGLQFAHAENWHALGSSQTTYAQQVVCEANEKRQCFEVSHCPQDECEPVDEERDGESVVTHENVQPCEVETCAAAAVSACGEAPISGRLMTRALAMFGIAPRVERNGVYGDIDGDGKLESFCSVATVERVKVKVLKPDAAKVNAKRIAENQRNLEKETRQTKKIQRTDALKACVKLVNPTSKQTQDCLMVVMKELAQHELSTGEL